MEQPMGVVSELPAYKGLGELKAKRATLAGYRVQARGMASLFDAPPPKWLTPTALGVGGVTALVALGATKAVFKTLITVGVVGGASYLALRYATSKGV
jgi:hypothetical protein